MALSDPHQLQVINQIAESLSSCERRTLFYLCDSLDTDYSVACVKEMLKSKVISHETGHFLLSVLMLHLRRFDILKKVCKTSRDEVERNLKDIQVLPRYRVLMADISEDLENEDLNSVKFLLGGMLPRDKSERAKNFLDVIIELEKLDEVSPARVDLVEDCLRNIGRIDLAKKVSTYKISGVTPEQHSLQQQRFRAPHQLPPPIRPHPPQTRLRQSLYRAPESKPMLVSRVQNCQSQLDWYKFNTNPRGVCVIIDCVGNDGDMLEQTFKALHFKVILHKLLTLQEAYSVLHGIFRKRENHEGDGFVCCIISRGSSDRLLGTDPHGAGLHLDRVRHLFTGDSCPMLAGKPKLFFIQRYSIPESQPYSWMNHRAEDLETDGFDARPRYGAIPTDADVFWSHCWTDERQLEQGYHRSIYLQALTDALHEGQRRKTSLVDIHTEVNAAIFEHNKRNPGESYHVSLKHTLRKDLYI